MTIVDTYSLTPTNISNSNVAYPTSGVDNTTLWAVGTTYAAGALVYYNNKNYQSLLASNVGKQPDTNPTWWLDQGYCNRFKAIDTIISSQTQNTNTITFDIDTNISDVGYIGLFNIDGYSVTIAQKDVDTNTPVASITESLYEDMDTSWYDYYFEEPTFKQTYVLALQPFKNSKVTVTIDKTGSTAKVGTVALGTSKYLGGVFYGASIGIIDYSKKDVNEFGDVYLKQGKYSDVGTYDLWLPSGSTTAIHQKLRAKRGTACVWIPDESMKYSSMPIYGFFRDFQVVVDNGTVSKCNLQLESLT